MVAKSTTSPNERVLKLVAAALNLQQAGETDEALSTLQRAQQQAPDYAPIHLLIGLLYRDAGRLEEAEEKLRHAIELDPQFAEAAQSLGLLLLAQKRSAEAVEWFKRHTELRPGDPDTLKALATELPRLNRQEEAIRILDEAWRKTRSPEAGITYGRHLIRMGQWEQAEGVLRQVSEETPQPKALVEWAYALVLRKEYERALQVLLRIIDIDPDFDRAWRGLTECYVPLGQYSEALMAAEQALAINNRHCRNWLAKTNALLSLERFADACEATTAGIECVPRDNPEARPVLHELYLQVIESLFQLGRPDDALAQLEEARREFPAGERLLQIQVSALHQLGHSQEALAVLDQAQKMGVQLEESLAPLYYETLHLAGHPDRAQAFIAPLLADEKEHRLTILTSIGLSLYERGRVASAQAVFAQLHEFAPEVSDFASNLGFVLTGEGQLAEAERVLTQALEIPKSGSTQALVLANLGYLNLITGEYARAAEYLEKATAQAANAGTAILRIAYWQDDRVLPEYDSHPTRWLPAWIAVQANRITLGLAQGKIQVAENLARQLVEDAPDSPWGYIMLGWVLRATENWGGAREMWNQAIELSDDLGEQEALDCWLDSLPD